MCTVQGSLQHLLSLIALAQQHGLCHQEQKTAGREGTCCCEALHQCLTACELCRLAGERDYLLVQRHYVRQAAGSDRQEAGAILKACVPANHSVFLVITALLRLYGLKRHVFFVFFPSLCHIHSIVCSARTLYELYCSGNDVTH